MTPRLPKVAPKSAQDGPKMTKEAPRWPQDGPYANLPQLHKICPGKFALRKIWLSKSRALRIARRAKFARAAGRQIFHNTTITQFWLGQILRKLGVAQTCVHVGRVAFAAARCCCCLLAAAAACWLMLLAG